MGILAAFFKNENLKKPAANPANSANFDAAGNLNSQNSQDSQHVAREIENCVAMRISRDSQNSQPYGCKSENPNNRSTEERRASVDVPYARMEDERERRRDWYVQPVEGWRDGRLTLHNIARDETVVIDLRKWRSER